MAICSVSGMTATVEVEPGQGSFGGDAVTGWLAEVLAGLGGLAAGTVGVPEAVRVDRIAVLERVKAAAAAAQCAEIVGFARAQVAAQQDAGVDYRRLGRGIGDQVALACHTSPWHGARKLTLARDLIQELPEIFGLLAAGRLSEYVAQLVATETSHLDPDVRREVDQQLVAGHVEECGPKAAAGLARKLAQATDPHGAVKRARKARADRHVSLRPAPDTMTWFGALLPVEDGVACLAALTRHCDTLKAQGDERTRGQIMADTTLARVTGQEPADGHPVELNLTVPLEHLTDPGDHTPADLPGYGPIPAGLVDDILVKAEGRVWWRRLFTAPATHRQGRVVVGGAPQQRPVRRLARHPPETPRRRHLPGAVLRRPHPAPRPPHLRSRGRPHRARQRPRPLRTAQLHPPATRLAHRSPGPQSRHPGGYRHHYSHRTHLPQPRPGPTPTNVGRGMQRDPAYLAESRAHQAG